MAIVTPVATKPFHQLTPKPYTGEARARCYSRQQKIPITRSSKCQNEIDSLRVFVVSDVHTDYSENMEWIRRISPNRYQSDVLIVAGDIAETYSNFVLTMTELRNKFNTVFFVPGNHDLWCRREAGKFMNSLEKLTALLDACREIGVETGPKTVDDLGIIPLYSWYHKSFDKEKDITGFRIPSLEMACKDFHACQWPLYLSNDDMSLARYFDEINEKNQSMIDDVQRKSSQIITFSHFVPRQELCPEKRMLFYPNLPKLIGSDLLETRLRYIHQNAKDSEGCHVFGHTHFCWDTVLDKIRYVQAPLAYPKERERTMNGGEDWLPFCIFNKGFTSRLNASYWSNYYSMFKREPDNTDLAPWVARFYKR